MAIEPARAAEVTFTGPYVLIEGVYAVPTDSPVRSVAAHPGYATTNLQAHLGGAWAQKAQDLLARVSPFVQSAAGGALPSLYAATSPDVPGGSYVGPSGLGETTGPPVLVGSSRASRDVTVQRGLWDLATRLTGVDFPLPDGPTMPTDSPSRRVSDTPARAGTEWRPRPNDLVMPVSLSAGAFDVTDGPAVELLALVIS